eukprot:CAMPEP_0205920728 /NCGR_PEP_ID=MMETSP1325-20131115/11656_1 /ASSEMBLY_ACC=CAM_ASM_000708 /TAXON_ID=236786 /ORGANISM="Florenciella sp., Strain RCC1007" /LENGTH=113 /DNA_ID=CAMNT_0053288449 /DNA_START=52 /DNA_END=393 /DNA_ORIENTATION=-
MEATRRMMQQYLQDLPPEGGYPEVRYRPKPTVRGPSGAMIWGLSVLAVCGGFYRVGQTNIARRAEKEEKREARFAIAPLLQAEEDLRYVQARRNGEVSSNVYKSEGIWFPPTV